MTTPSPTPATRLRRDARFRAMGSTAHVVVVGDDADVHVERAQRRIEHLERRWSRFLADSEVSRMNGHAGVPVVVSADTFGLVERSVQASTATGGRFNPLVGAALEALGYDRDFAAMSESGAAGAVGASHYQPRAVDLIRLDRYLPAVTLPMGARFDPGGIGKGLAADIVVDELMVAGARGVMVNLGGDIAIAGTPPDEHGWIVGIEDPARPGTHLARVTVVAGGVCTSSRAQRTWTTAGGDPVHHLVDPQTGAPVESSVVTVTVVAGAAWWAEALTKLVFVAGPDAIADHLDGAHVLVVHADGSVQTFGGERVFDTESDRSGVG